MIGEWKSERVKEWKNGRMEERKASSTLPSFHSPMCPVCDRFVGAAGVCPYCDAGGVTPRGTRMLRYAALLLAGLGLLFLYLAATHRDIPVIRIGEIGPTMNFAYVRVVGSVKKSPYVAKEDGEVDYVSFLVSDGSGSIRAAAYGDVARKLVDANRLPEKGERVDVAGSLSVTADGRTRLRLQSPAQLRPAG